MINRKCLNDNITWMNRLYQIKSLFFFIPFNRIDIIAESWMLFPELLSCYSFYLILPWSYHDHVICACAEAREGCDFGLKNVLEEIFYWLKVSSQLLEWFWSYKKKSLISQNQYPSDDWMSGHKLNWKLKFKLAKRFWQQDIESGWCACQILKQIYICLVSLHNK